MCAWVTIKCVCLFVLGRDIPLTTPPIPGCWTARVPSESSKKSSSNTRTIDIWRRFEPCAPPQLRFWTTIMQSRTGRAHHLTSSKIGLPGVDAGGGLALFLSLMSLCLYICYVLYQPLSSSGHRNIGDQVKLQLFKVPSDPTRKLEPGVVQVSQSFQKNRAKVSVSE